MNKSQREHNSNISINTIISDKDAYDGFRGDDDERSDLIQSGSRRPGKVRREHSARQKKFVTQRSILKNSQDNTTAAHEDQELLEAKKQVILRKRRLFSHYRQYQEWRRRQFSYDPCYYRATPTPTATNMGGNIGVGISAAVSGGVGDCDYAIPTFKPNAYRRRRQYRRQFSCAERSREDSRESRDSSHLLKCHSMGASDTIRSDSTSLIHTNPATDRHSVSRFSIITISFICLCKSRK